MDLLCQLQNINLSFGEKKIFHQAGFTLHPKDRVGLIGPNGQGKTTLFKILTGQVVPENSTPPFIFSKALGKEDALKEFSVFHVPQELPFCGNLGNGESELPQKVPTIATYPSCFYPELNLQDSGWDILNRYENYLKLFKVEGRERAVNTLSGGEQRKLAMALGLGARANLVLWDEPTNHLDLETIEIFENELLSGSKAFILITHDRYLLNRVCTRLLHIHKGEIQSFTGSYFEYLNFLEQNELKRQSLLDKLSNHMRREKAWMAQGIKARGTRNKKRVENYLQLKEDVSGLQRDEKKKVELGLHASGRKTRSLVELEDVSFSYPQGGTLQLKNLDLLLSKGEKIALLGNNGCGKTTLLKIMLGLLTPTQGRVKRAEGLSVHYFDQHREILDPEKTPFEIIGEGVDVIDLPGNTRRHVNSYLEGFLFSRNQIHRPIKTFSGGEKKRLQLAMFLKRGADLWVFDEPTNDLDLDTLTILEEKLREFAGTILVVGHDRAFLEQVTDKAWVLNDGSVEIFEGGLSQALLYLKDLAQEKMELEKSTLSKTPPPGEVKAKEDLKLTNREKKLLQELPALIENLEEKIGLLDQALETFDFQKAGHKEGHEKLASLQSERETALKDLDRLYEEWSALEEKMLSLKNRP